MIKVLQRDNLTLGGFAGLKEHRLVIVQNYLEREPIHILGMASAT